jgi:hypothetical protein
VGAFRVGGYLGATYPMTTNILYLLVPISIAWFGVLLRQAFEMERDRRFQRMWGTIAWSLIPFGVSALLWVYQGDISVVGRSLLLGLLGAAMGASIMIWLGFVFSPPAISPAPVSPSPAAAGVQPPSVQPSTPQSQPSKPLSPKALRELLDALNEAKTIQSKFVAPTMGQIDSWAVNWRGVLRNYNGVELYSRLREELKTLVWEKIDGLIERHKQYESELQVVFALDHPVAKNDLSRALQGVIEAIQRLPPNSPPEMDELLEPQFKELIKQSNLGWAWVTEVSQRLDKMTENVSTRGVAEYR